MCKSTCGDSASPSWVKSIQGDKLRPEAALSRRSPQQKPEPTRSGSRHMTSSQTSSFKPSPAQTPGSPLHLPTSTQTIPAIQTITNPKSTQHVSLRTSSSPLFQPQLTPIFPVYLEQNSRPNNRLPLPNPSTLNPRPQYPKTSFNCRLRNRNRRPTVRPHCARAW